ncbi:unnamed protein product, partial [Meganyctiphanes norvegica]
VLQKGIRSWRFSKRLLKEFAVELTTPYCDIINSSLKNKIFLDCYKKADIVPIPKINPYRALSNLRPISTMHIGGKITEKRMYFQLERDIKNKLNTDQYGNKKGCSTCHYLIKLTDEAYRATDKGLATTAITVDYSKAFDYVSHNVLIDKLI